MCSRAAKLLSSALTILHRSSNAYTCKILEPLVFPKRTLSAKSFPHQNNDVKKDEPNTDEHNLSGAMGREFEEFRDELSPVIFDVDEEKKKIIDHQSVSQLHDYRDPFAGLNLKRGSRGVYDIEDLVELLQRDKAKEIFVVSVPPENSYVDYIVVVTGKSARHMSALATFVRKVYKIKGGRKDLIPKIEGETSQDWMALDLGNIALHIFSSDARRSYDLETLWAVGRKYDSQLNTKNSEEEFAAKYNKYLEGLQPADA